MINFEKLVESVLLFESVDAIKNVLTTNPALTTVNKETTDTYPIPPNLPNQEPFYKTIQDSVFTRSSAYVLAEDDMLSYYAFIDYLCYMNENRKTGSATNFDLLNDDFVDVKFNNTIGNLTNAWIDHFKGDGTAPAKSKPEISTRHPVIDYIPLSSTLKGLRNKLLEILMAKGVLGKLALQNYIKNNYNLAEAINSAVTLGQTNIPLINRKQEDKNINDVLLNPTQYAVGAPGGASSLMGRVASAVTSPKQLPEKAKPFKESILAIAQAIPGYIADKGIKTNEDAIKKLVQEIQGDATTSTNAKLIIQQLEAMSNHLPGKKDYAGLIGGLTQATKGGLLGTKMMGS